MKCADSLGNKKLTGVHQSFPVRGAMVGQAGDLDDGVPPFSALNNTQRAFLNIVGKSLHGVPWTPDSVEAVLLTAARTTPIEQALAARAVSAFTGSPEGLRSGETLTLFARHTVIDRLKSVSYSRRQLVEDTSFPPGVALEILASRRTEIQQITLTMEFDTVFLDGGVPMDSCRGVSYVDGIGAAVVEVVANNGQRETIRVELSRFKGEGSSADIEKEVLTDLFEAFASSVRATVPARVICQRAERTAGNGALP